MSNPLEVKHTAHALYYHVVYCHLQDLSVHYTHSFIYKLLQGAVQFIPHVVHVLFYVVLCVVPLLL